MQSLIIMVGLSGSGKTTQAKRIAEETHALVWSLNNLRNEFAAAEGVVPALRPWEEPTPANYVSAWQHSKFAATDFANYSNMTFARLLHRCRLEGVPLLLDNMHLSVKTRATAMKKAKVSSDHTHIVYCATPPEMARDWSRRRISEVDWQHHLQQLEVPTESEAGALQIIRP